jgi:hypothetical protein
MKVNVFPLSFLFDDDTSWVPLQLETNVLQFKHYVNVMFSSRGMTTMNDHMRIGDLAQRAGVTHRTFVITRVSACCLPEKVVIK